MSVASAVESPLSAAPLAGAPLVQWAAVFHVGDLSAPPTRRTLSYEGPGLSVSLCPRAWTAIARLGGGTTYTLRRRDGAVGRFLDARRLMARQRRAVRVWAQYHAEWVTAGVAFEVRETDDDGGARWSLFPTAAGAVGECDMEEARDVVLAQMAPRLAAATTAITTGARRRVRLWHDPDTAQALTAVRTLMPTVSLVHWWHATFSDPLPLCLVEDAVLMRAVAETTDLDGLWFDAPFDPLELQAPAGVIVPRAEALWDAQVTTRADRMRHARLDDLA